MSAEALAERLRAAHPDLEPFELDAEAVSGLVRAAGADPEALDLVAEALVAWERLIA